MSPCQYLTAGVCACGAVLADTSDASTCAAQSHWRQERLPEARGILADIAHHPDTLVLLACHVVCGCSSDTKERTDALGVIRLLAARPRETACIAPKGGAA